jgi:hypothetical protein
MFESNEPPKTESNNKPIPLANSSAKYKNILTTSETEKNEINYSAIDNLLEKEKIHNKSEAWNKLDKTVKIQKLHIFAEKYGKDHTLPIKDIKSLKLFFNDSLDKNKLQKTKDVLYDKEKGTVQSIPALFFNISNRAFTLKNLDTKRVSTIKSLTPRRISEKSNISENESSV